MAIDEHRIVNLSTNKGLKFYAAQAFNDNIQMNNVQIPNPNSSSSDTLVFNFGSVRLVDVEFILFDDGSDQSVDGDNIVSLGEQWNYLTETVLIGKTSTNLDISHQLVIRSGTGTTRVFTGIIEDCSVRTQLGDSPNVLFGKITLRVGTN